jgi:outer membrane receptor protein involved in Fe transport
MTKFIQLSIIVLSCLFSISLAAQKGVIAGKIIDSKSGEALIGVTVRLDEGAGGAISDFDGNFNIANVPVGQHKIAINYTGYSPKTIEAIEVKNGDATTVDIALEDAAAAAISEVVIVARANRESQSALTILQKTSSTIGDGISSEAIKRTPDRTTGDVIRRVSGATIQDNKFAVIRGLNDRYNIAMLNGALLSSTEPDRKAFSFDIFPSSMLDNLVVVKTASPDLPGEFAGGAILVTTKDIPEASFLQANLNAGYNTVTTFEPFMMGQAGGSDWLGHDDGTRALPASFPNTADFKALSDEETFRFSQLVPNDWAIQEKSSASPNKGFQISGGYVTNPEKKIQFGATLGLSYSNANRLQIGNLAEYEIAGKQTEYSDKRFKNNVLWGTLFNAALKVNNNQKIGVQATYSTNTDNIISNRSGYNYAVGRLEESTSIEYTENHLLTTRLYGEHSLNAKGMRLSWGGGVNSSSRDVPSLRRMLYLKYFEDTTDVTIPFQAYIPFGSADPYRSGRFYSTLEELTYNGNVDFSIPFIIGSQKQTAKIGALYQKRDRNFDARVMGFVLSNYGFDVYQPQDQIFATENIGSSGVFLDEITNPSDGYDGKSNLLGGYLLLDNKIADRLRISWGARVENFRQQVEAAQYGGIPLKIDTTITAFLPSFNMTYSINEKHQLRLSGSKTVCRAEFRELAPFSFFDFYLNANVVGNPKLTQGSIYNADIRYEIYPGQNQLFSFSLFYKRFKNPIEFVFASPGAGTRIFSFNNVASANNYGVELELRKNFDFIGAENLMFFSNASLIRSNIDLSSGVSYYDSTRALQGQSPYIVNAGLTYNIPKIGLSTTVIYNVIGDRIAQVGTVGFGDIYERHRNLLDFSVNKKLGKHGEIKLTWSDILHPEFVYYQDDNATHKFEDGTDNVVQRLNFGSTISLGLGYRF